MIPSDPGRVAFFHMSVLFDVSVIVSSEKKLIQFGHMSIPKYNQMKNQLEVSITKQINNSGTNHVRNYLKFKTSSSEKKLFSMCFGFPQFQYSQTRCFWYNNCFANLLEVSSVNKNKRHTK